MKSGVLRHPGRWIWLPLIILGVIGLSRLRFEAEVFDLLPADLPVVQGLRLYQRYFANARDLIITLQGHDAAQVERSARAVAEQLRPQTNLVASATWEAPWMEHPEQVSELMACLWFNQPPAIFKTLPDRFAPAQLSNTFAAARDQLATGLSPEEIGRLSYDPLGLTSLPESASGAAPSFTQGGGMFGSPDGTFRVVYVRAASELRNYDDCDRWLDSVKPIISEAVASSENGTAGAVEIGYTGRPAFVTEVATGMKHDILISVGGTSAVIAVLFWLAHRRFKPMLWLLALLALVLAGTLALGGLIYGTINVLSVGFAAILLGLAVDYAVVHYQEALVHADLSIPEIRAAIAPSIFWAAVTTISAFLVLNFGGLPGLGQLGSLVGLGVALAAAVMIFEYLPPLFPDRQQPKPRPAPSVAIESAPPPVARHRIVVAMAATVATALVALVILIVDGAPRVDSTANALRPRDSAAYAALDQMATNLNQARQPLWLIADGKSVEEVAGHLARAEAILNRGISNQAITSFTLPTPIWPRPDFQAANRATARELGGFTEQVRSAGKAGGFAPRSLALADNMIDQWRADGAGSGVLWPTNALSRWILDKATARAPDHYLALGLVNARDDDPRVPAIAADLAGIGVHLSGWQMLGSAIFFRVKDNMWKVVSPMIFLVLLSLWLAFRRLPEILLGLAVLALSGLCLLVVMRLAGWSWNLLDLMAVPLMLGTGVDYGLFSQLALRRHNGDLGLAYRSVGRALLLCGGTAVAAFASLAFSTNAGMASLGEVCAVGIGANMLIAVFLLPVWWLKVAGPKREMERNQS